MVRLAQWLAQVAAHQVLIPQFSTKGRSPGFPVEVGIHAYAVNIGAVVVVLHLLGFATIALVAVAVLIPVDTWRKVQSAALRLTLNGGVELGGVLVLVVGLPLGCGVRCARAPALIGYAQVPVQPHVIVLILPLIKAFSPAKICVQRARFASRVAIAAAVRA